MAPESTQANPMGVQDLVRALGGPAVVGRGLGLRTVAVCMWYAPGRDRIPPEHVPALWRLAQARGVPWTPPGFEGVRLVPVDNPHPGDATVKVSPSARENTVKVDDAA